MNLPPWIVSEWTLGDYREGYPPPFRVQRRPQRGGAVLWSVTDGFSVLAKDGTWEHEPNPSSRDDAFLDRCRFASADEAMAAAVDAMIRQNETQRSGA